MLCVQFSPEQPPPPMLSIWYCTGNFVIEARMWYDMWAGLDDIKFQLVDHISHTEYLLAIRHAFNILLTLPATTCTVERSLFFNLTPSKNLATVYNVL